MLGRENILRIEKEGWIELNRARKDGWDRPVLGRGNILRIEKEGRMG